MLRKIPLLSAFMILSAGCEFYWNGPVEVRLKDKQIITCEKVGRSNYDHLACRQKGGEISISWGTIAGITTK